MDDRLRAEIEEGARVALQRPARLSTLTDEGVARAVILPYFQTLPGAPVRRHLVDIGAALGGIADAFLRVGWTADLLEPDPAWQPALQRLSVAFGAQCRVHPVAACDRNVEQISFSINATPGLSGFSPSPFGVNQGHIPVRGTRLDTFLADLHTQRVDFLKIDTEGSDFDVLETHDFHHLPPALVFVEYSYYFPGQTPALVQGGLERMRERGYHALIFEYDDDGNFRRGSWRHRLTAIHADPATVPQRANSFGNLLFFRDGDAHLPRIALSAIASLS